MRKGAVPAPIPIGQPIPMVATDLERFREQRYVASTPQKLRDSHHMIARLAASGLRTYEIEERTGYSYVRIRDLLASPAMEELIAQYRKKVDEAFVQSQDQFFTLATRNMLAAERHIADHIAELDETGELLPVRTALAISRDAADRFGYGKKTQNLNINVDFAAQLERAIARSGKGPVLDGAPAQPATAGVLQSPRPARERSEASRPSAPSPTPIRRRA
jgi:hypothetical protein